MLGYGISLNLGQILSYMFAISILINFKLKNTLNLSTLR